MTAFDHWTAMHAWWCARRTEREAIGRAWPPRAAQQMSDEKVAHLTDVCKDDPNRGAGGERTATLPPAPDPTRRRELLARYQALPPEAKRLFKALKVDGDILDHVEQALDEIEAVQEAVQDKPGQIEGTGPANQAASPGAPSPPTTTLQQAKQRMADDKARKRKAKPPQAKPESLDDAVATVRARYGLIADTGKQWIKRLVTEGDNAGLPWRLSDELEARRINLYRGAISLAGWFTTPDDDIVRSIAANITGTYSPDTPAGAVIGALNAEQAERFAQIAADLTTEKYTPIPDPATGGYRLTPATQGETS